MEKEKDNGINLETNYQKYKLLTIKWIISVEEIAEILNVSERTIYRYKEKWKEEIKRESLVALKKQEYIKSIEQLDYIYSEYWKLADFSTIFEKSYYLKEQLNIISLKIKYLWLKDNI